MGQGNRQNLLWVLLALVMSGPLCACHTAAPPISADFVQSPEDRVRLETMRETLEEVVNGGGNLGRYSALKKQVADLDLTQQARSEGIDWFSLQRNLIIELPGDSEDIIYLVAHYDKTDANPFAFVSLLLNGALDSLISPTFTSDGAIDNASGVSVILQLASELSSKQHHYTYRIFFPGSEETGLRGSRAHVARLGDEERQRIKYVINVDSVGVTGAGNCVTKDISDPHLSYLARTVAQRKDIELEQDAPSGSAVSDYLPFMETSPYDDVSYGFKFNYVGGILPQRSWFTDPMSVPILNFSTCGLMGGTSDLLSSFLLPIGKLHGYRDDIEKIDFETLYNQFLVIDGLLLELEKQFDN